MASTKYGRRNLTLGLKVIAREANQLFGNGRVSNRRDQKCDVRRFIKIDPNGIL
ncbi:MAG: hypothetical protein ACR2NX_10330 [Chthoniobacterales bacterium]